LGVLKENLVSVFMKDERSEFNCVVFRFFSLKVCIAHKCAGVYSCVHHPV